MSTTAETPQTRDKAETLLLTTEEALRWISKASRGTRFYLHVQMDTPVADSDGSTVYRDAAHGAVRLPGHEMMDFLRHGLTDTMEARGARWRCTVSRWKSLDKTRVSYWVG